MAAFVFFRIVVSVISHGKKRKKEKKIGTAGSRFVGWFMINIVSKNHTQIRVLVRKIERGMANLPFPQLLGWPSSYVLVLYYQVLYV